MDAVWTIFNSTKACNMMVLNLRREVKQGHLRSVITWEESTLTLSNKKLILWLSIVSSKVKLFPICTIKLSSL